MIEILAFAFRRGTIAAIMNTNTNVRHHTEWQERCAASASATLEQFLNELPAKQRKSWEKSARPLITRLDSEFDLVAFP
jgi:hypothetical protein